MRMSKQKFSRPISPDLLAFGILFLALFSGFIILILGTIFIVGYIYYYGYHIEVLAYLCFMIFGLTLTYILARFAQPISIYFYRKHDDS
ncbi:hypothetical protein C9J12_05635 [Photobacterium frigidiphilum]|uniref:Transmembrane protein n=1 Tax=Photobacterium frigidiphilum TaxID=264736 RepID=A0A2T3JMF1_9GAMM|nr:hypothetical protein C9J12_05635 [Photobacterium frigidiphilum]